LSILDSYKTDELAVIVSECHSMSDLIRRLGYTTKSGDLYASVRKRLAFDGISTDHFSKRSPIRRDESNIFIKDSTASQRTLRNWVIKNELLPYLCSICGLDPIWNGKPLSLTLDHIDGDSHNDEITNLRWVCPNCDRQLETFGSKNCSTVKRRPNFCIDCNRQIGRNAVRCKSCAAIVREKDKRP